LSRPTFFPLTWVSRKWMARLIPRGSRHRLG